MDWSWAEASAYCQTNHNGLYSINSAEKQGWVESLATSNSIQTKAWAGFLDDDLNTVWTWSDGSSVDGYNNWRAPTHPISNLPKMVVRLDQIGTYYAKWDSTSAIVNNVGAILCKCVSCVPG